MLCIHHSRIPEESCANVQNKIQCYSEVMCCLIPFVPMSCYFSVTYTRGGAGMCEVQE